MRVLHLLAAGGTGGIETLNKDYGVFSKIENIFIFIWGSGATTEEMKESGLNVIELHASKKDLFGPWKSICKVCKDKGIDVVVVHHASPIAHLYLMLLKKKYPKIKTIAYAHGNAEDMRGGSGKRGLTLRRWLIKKSLQKADHVMAISYSVKDSLIKCYNVLSQKITVIYNGVDVHKMAAELHPKHNPIEIVYVGRLIKQKGVQVTLQALAMLPPTVKWHFSIIGDGEYRSELEKQVEDTKLMDCVTFCGTCRNVPELLAKADIFIHSPVWEEGFGLTIAEAMAAGLICICAKSGAIPEIIHHGIDGYLFEKKNANELVSMLLTCINEYDTEKMKKVRMSAIERVKSFSIEFFAEQLDKVLCGTVVNTIDGV